MFVRAKKQGNRVYYYLVESKRIKGQPRLKVIKYLGVKKPSLEELEKIIKEGSQ